MLLVEVKYFLKLRHTNGRVVCIFLFISASMTPLPFNEIKSYIVKPIKIVVILESLGIFLHGVRVNRASLSFEPIKVCATKLIISTCISFFLESNRKSVMTSKTNIAQLPTTS